MVPPLISNSAMLNVRFLRYLSHMTSSCSANEAGNNWRNFCQQTKWPQKLYGNLIHSELKGIVERILRTNQAIGTIKTQPET